MGCGVIMTWCVYRLKEVLPLAYIIVSRHILVLDISVFAKDNMGRREYKKSNRSTGTIQPFFWFFFKIGILKFQKILKKICGYSKLCTLQACKILMWNTLYYSICKKYKLNKIWNMFTHRYSSKKDFFSEDIIQGIS
jgi:hypothetical protein